MSQERNPTRFVTDPKRAGGPLRERRMSADGCGGSAGQSTGVVLWQNQDHEAIEKDGGCVIWLPEG